MNEFVYEMTVEEMASELYKKYDVDYSYTTLKEAAPMIEEDYEAFTQFEETIRNVVAVLEDAAGSIFQNGAIREYFKKHYNYDEEMDYPVYTMLEYINDLIPYM